MLYFHLGLMALTAVYVFLVRLWLHRYIGYNFSPKTYTKFFRREDFWGKVVLGCLFTMQVIITWGTFSNLSY